jgi:ATP-dependent DNA helicase RecG
MRQKNLSPTAGSDNQTSADKLLSPVNSVKGVGEVFARELRKRGIHTIYDLLYLLPRSYQDRRKFISIRDIRTGQSALIRGRITGIRRRRFKYRTVLEMIISDGTGIVFARWMGAPRYLFRFRRGEEIIIYGQFRTSSNLLLTYHPEIIEKEDQQDVGRLAPVYPEIEGISSRRMRKIVADAVIRFTEDLEDPLPQRIRDSSGLLRLNLAFREAHFPTESTPRELLARKAPAQRRLIFDEFFTLQLALALKRSKACREPGIAFGKKDVNELYRLLPYRLTTSQRRVLDQVLADMNQPVPMNRLLQGDVGCGKTVVALIAAWVAVKNGYQVAFMAPTQILAEQHYFSTLGLVQNMNLSSALLTSGMGNRGDEVRHDVEKGKVEILIGTHALIQESVEFRRLGLVIIDEQHRFGVAQRALLRQKGLSPDLLTLTATPIPRTLGLTLYGDLDISVIDELPPGRQPIQTRLVREGDRNQIYEILKAEISKGRQAYMVYPLIEESEKMDLNAATQMAEQVQYALPEFRIALIHGRMPLEQRAATMQEFKDGVTDILVSTTVIEVGIDVPNATLMIIENAERFGLAQIHQLRGRVGRSSYPSQCLLVTPVTKTGVAGTRLRVIEKTTDGFKIAEEDLALRGPGEFLGVKQSGFYQFRAGNLMRDASILSEARQQAFELVETQPKLARNTFRIFRRLFNPGEQAEDEFVDVL